MTWLPLAACLPKLTQEQSDKVNAALQRLKDYHESKGLEVHGMKFLSPTEQSPAKERKSKGDKARSRKEHRERYRV